MKISVAIPIYNAARHLNVTLDSLIKQTMPSSDFEVICVNDRSTDNSRAVIEGYMKTMDNLVLIDREVNSGGPMIPRNNAIEAARGEYILFLDNDDFLGEETLDRLYRSADENNSDVIYGKYVGVNGRHVPESMFKKGNRLNADMIEDNLLYSLAPHKMFKLSFVRENGFEFHPKAVVGEDQLFVMQCYINAKVITVMADYDYYYVVSRGNENLSLKYFPAEQFFFSFNRIMEFLEASSLNELYKRSVKIAFLNRFLHASRLRGHLLSGLLTREQKTDWLNETKRFLDNHVEDKIIPSLASRFQYLVTVAKDNDIEKLLSVHNQVENITSNHVTRVQNGLIYAKVHRLSKECSYNEELVVNHKNTSNVFVSEMQLEDTRFIVKGDFTQSLLLNFDITYELILVHRSTGIEKVHRSPLATSSGKYEFEVDYKEVLFNEALTGPWDLFVQASIGSYVKRRRIGASRSPWLKEERTISGISSFGRKYSIRSYFTKPHDNISLDIRLED